jgi:hypothetical protein
MIYAIFFKEDVGKGKKKNAKRKVTMEEMC